MGCHSTLSDHVKFVVFDVGELYFFEPRFVVGVTSSAENRLALINNG